MHRSQHQPVENDMHVKDNRVFEEMLISNSTREYYHINCKLAVYKSKSQAVLLLYMSESHPSTHLVFPLNEFYNKVKMIVEYTNSLANSIFVSWGKIMLIKFRITQVIR